MNEKMQVGFGHRDRRVCNGHIGAVSSAAQFGVNCGVDHRKLTARQLFAVQLNAHRAEHRAVPRVVFVSA